LNDTISLDLFQTYQLSQDVISCIQAARFKEIPLKNELKSLILTTSKGLCVLHLPGDATAALRKVKRAISVDEACLASTEQLCALNLRPGTVCPFLPQLWHLPQVITEEILHLPFISTNNGTRNHYIVFPPELLLHSEQHVVGCFTK
jgi:prolyl-tRNA editing enzyme YbaK/EbsC (Cys-tRNA(Pro) deacylase)